MLCYFKGQPDHSLHRASSAISSSNSDLSRVNWGLSLLSTNKFICSKLIGNLGKYKSDKLQLREQNLIGRGLRELMEPLSHGLGSCGDSVHLNISLSSSSLTRQPQIRPSVCLSVCPDRSDTPSCHRPDHRGVQARSAIRSTIKRHNVARPRSPHPWSRNLLPSAAKSRLHLRGCEKSLSSLFFYFFLQFRVQASTDSLNVKQVFWSTVSIHLNKYKRSTVTLLVLIFYCVAFTLDKF